MARTVRRRGPGASEQAVGERQASGEAAHSPPAMPGRHLAARSLCVPLQHMLVCCPHDTGRQRLAASESQESLRAVRCVGPV